MDSSDLETWQAQRINDRVMPMLRYIGALRARMEKKDFPPDDRLWQLVEQTFNDLHALSVETHYLACGMGRGRNSRK